jgi:hypothetical protein
MNLRCIANYENVHEFKVYMVASCENTVRVRFFSGFCEHARLDTLTVHACPICSVNRTSSLGTTHGACVPTAVL